MSSGFVSGGTTDQPIERDDEWLKAQQEIEASHRRKEEASRQEGGKTLYEVLQRNKGEYQHPHHTYPFIVPSLPMSRFRCLGTRELTY